MNALTTAGKKLCSLLGFGTSIYGNYVDHMDDIQQVCSRNPYTIDCGWAMIKPAVSGVAGATAGALCGAGAGYLTSQVGGVAYAPAAAMAAGTYCYDLAENYVDGLLYQMEDNNFIN